MVKIIVIMETYFKLSPTESNMLHICTLHDVYDQKGLTVIRGIYCLNKLMVANI